MGKCQHPTTPHPATCRPGLLAPGDHLFDGPHYRYTFVAPLLDEQEEISPMLVARRVPLAGASTEESVLLKHVVLPPEAERRQRAAEELRLASRLHHPNIARVLGVEEYQGEPYVVTEYTPGLFLETALLLGRALSLGFCAYTAAEVADALEAAWTCEDEDGRPLRIVHRAVCPLTLRLEHTGGVKLTDLGLAHAHLPGRLRTRSQVLRAVTDYASPEVRGRQPFDGRADLFSLGLVLWEMISGQPPLDPPDVRLPPVESADVPEPLKRILHKALAARPEDRYPSAGAMRDELRGWLRERGQEFGPIHAARELRALLRDRPAPEETRPFPSERGMRPTPEERAMTRPASRGGQAR